MPINARDVMNTISEIYLYSVQNIQQTVSSLQEISLDCSGKTVEICLQCQAGIQESLLTINPNLNIDEKLKTIQKTCAFACSCDIKDINLSQVMSVNMTAGLYNKTDEELSTQIISILNAKEKEKDGTMSIPSSASTRLSSVKNINSYIKTETFQSAVQGLSASQVIRIKGAANISNVDIESSINFVSDILQSSETASSIINNLMTELMASTEAVTEAGLLAVITWVIRLVVVFIFLLAMLATIYLALQIFGRIS